MGPYATAEGGGHRDNSVGYPTFPFMPSVEHMPPSGAARTEATAARAEQSPAKLSARVWTAAYNLTYAFAGLRKHTSRPTVEIIYFLTQAGEIKSFFPYFGATRLGMI